LRRDYRPVPSLSAGARLLVSHGALVDAHARGRRSRRAALALELAAIEHSLQLSAFRARDRARRFQPHRERAADALAQAAFRPRAQLAHVVELVREAVRARLAQELLAH